MKRQRLVLIVGVALVLANSVTSQGGELPKALTYSGQAIANSAQGVSSGLLASGQLVSGVVAVPLLISGSVGQVSNAAGTDLWNAAVTPIGTPLAVTDESITVGPPPDATLSKKTTRPPAVDEYREERP